MTKRSKRFLSVVLAFSLCMMCCNGFPVYANEDVEKPIESCYNEAEDISENKQTEKFIVSDTFMSYIDESGFKSHNHTNRLAEQEKLNTYVFQNADKTTSVYYFSENLKYIDDSGKVVEKDLSLVEAKNGYTINKSDIDILLPNAPASGISVGYDDFSISITPITASKLTSTEKIKAEKSDGTVVYNGIFGDNTKLVYTPILSGLKEDIILSEYVANAEFSFTIKTGGLRIVEKDGGYYIASAEKSEPIFNLGEVVVYDAVGKPSAGKMTVKTVTDSSEYIVTIAADENFLKDSGTVYPVTIDPTITVSDNTHGKGAIEDAPIYQGYPNTNFGTYIYNPVGTPAEEYGVGRTVVRLTDLISSTEYASISAAQITDVTFYVKEGSGGSTQYINIYPLFSNTTWTESTVTWNNVGLSMPLANYAGILMGGQWSEFNITSLVKAWKNETYPASAGFIMVASDESINRCFLSSEYSITSYRPYVVMTYDAAISLNHSSVSVVEGGTTTLVATAKPSGQAVTWSTSDNTIATVNSNGVVTAKKAGTTTITATMVDADGVSQYAYCTVCVALSDGVYYIKNKNSNLYLTTTESVLTAPYVYQASKYESNVPELFRIEQMWKIKHLGNGLYSVRPYSKLDMGLHAVGDNDGLTYDSVNVTIIGTTDTNSGVLSSATWRITNAFGGYIFENTATNSYLQIYSSSTASYAYAITHFFSMTNNCLWELSKISSPPSGSYLYDVSKETFVDTASVFVDVGITRTPSQLGVIAVAYSGTNISQSFTWSSSNNSVATVNSNGAVTGVSTGISTITGYVYRNNSYYYVSYTVYVSCPSLFTLLINWNFIDIDCVDFTDDGLSLMTTPISTVLVNCGIVYLPINSTYTAGLNVNDYFDDWYIFAVKNGASESYGLYKMREQESDSYDEDTPGVTVSFVGFDSAKLLNCLDDDTDANKYDLYQALTKATGPEPYEADDIIASYFADTSSDGAYLIAEKCVRFFANGFSGNIISSPVNLVSIFEKIANIDELLDNPSLDNNERLILLRNKADLQRVPNALENINNSAGTTIFNFDNYTINVQNKNNLTLYEKQAILACFTADVTFNSFAAEVEFHADAIDDWKSIFDKWYNAAIRADMSIGEEYESGFYDDYYDLDGTLVKNQIAAHGEY